MKYFLCGRLLQHSPQHVLNNREEKGLVPMQMPPLHVEILRHHIHAGEDQRGIERDVGSTFFTWAFLS